MGFQRRCGRGDQSTAWACSLLPRSLRRLVRRVRRRSRCLMTTSALTSAVDPSGLGGLLVTRDETHAPDVLEIYEYPAALTFDVIEAAWRAAPRRPRMLVGAVTLYQQRGDMMVV